MQNFLFLALCGSAAAVKVSPIEKVVQLLGDLEAKIVKDGEAQQKIYEEFEGYCSDTSKQTAFEIKTGKADAERYSAAVDDSAAQIIALESKIGDLASATASNEKDLKDATELRNTEKADFLEADQDMAESVSMLRRAAAIIEKEMSKSPALLQQDTGSIQRVTAALQAVVAAAGVSMQDKAKLQALLQTQEDGGDFQPAGAPAPDAYSSQSGGILSTLEDMLEKAEAQQGDAQKAEMNAAHNFAMLKQGLEDAMKQQGKELAEAKKGKAGQEEAKAEAEGELERSNLSVKDGSKKLKDLQHECMTTAEAHEQEQHERSDELGALAAAKKIIQEKTGGAADRTYSFAQVSTKTRTTSQLRMLEQGDKVVALLQQLGQQEKQRDLSLLASKVRSALATQADPFAKVKDMIQEMVEKLVQEAADEAGKKAFCDKEMSETKAKLDDKNGEVDDLNTKIDKFTSKAAKLTEEIATLESELAAIAKEQQEADAMRQSQKDAWTSAKADFEGGLEGVQMALQVLRDYYSEKDSSFVQVQAAKETGAATGIIGMLEVAESDFSSMLAEGQATEDQALKEYESATQDNKVSTAEKRTAAKYAQKDKKGTEALLADTKEDLGVSQTELSAVLEYWAKLQPQCVAKAEPYEERKARREREIAGLKEALEILENESAPAFLQIRRS